MFPAIHCRTQTDNPIYFTIILPNENNTEDGFRVFFPKYSMISTFRTSEELMEVLSTEAGFSIGIYDIIIGR